MTSGPDPPIDPHAPHRIPSLLRKILKLASHARETCLRLSFESLTPRLDQRGRSCEPLPRVNLYITNRLLNMESSQRPHIAQFAPSIENVGDFNQEGILSLVEVEVPVGSDGYFDRSSYRPCRLLSTKPYLRMLSVNCKPCEYARCKVDSGANLLSLRDSEHAEVLVFMLVLLLRVTGVRPRCDFFVANVDELGSYDCVKGLTSHIVVNGEATLIRDGIRRGYSDETGGKL